MNGYVTTTECRAAAAVTYSLTDLGAGALLNDHGIYQAPYRAPYAGSTAMAPQVDDTGAVHYTTGRYDAGSYHLQGESIVHYHTSITKSGAPFAALDSSALDPTYRWSYGGGINASGAAVGFQQKRGHSTFYLTLPRKSPISPFLLQDNVGCPLFWSSGW